MNTLRRLAPRAWIAVLALVLTFIAIDSVNRIEHIHAASEFPAALMPVPAVDPASATGYEAGQRKIILPDSPDSYHWVMQTQQMFSTGEWRIRHVDYDNAPDGREVHWASPFRWWLGLLAWIDHTVTSYPIGLAIERAALYANPLLLGLILVSLTPWVARHFGSLSASILAVGLVSPLLYECFLAGAPDHHGAAAACALVALLGVLKGCDGAAEPTRQLVLARRSFALSGIAGGLGLWISAATLAPVIAAISVGAFFAALLGKKWSLPHRAMSNPALWRLWGRCGAATSLLSYLIEYFPSHLGWRLEVNHPLYSLAWLSAGELLARWWDGPGISGLFKTPSARRSTALAALGITLFPCTILFAPGHTFHVADPFLWALHHQYIEEFQSIAARLTAFPANLVILSSCLPLLLLVPVLRTLGRNTTPPSIRSGLTVAAVSVALTFIMATSQIRWLSLYQALSLAALIYGIRGSQTHALWSQRAVRLALILTLLPIPIATFRAALKTHELRNGLSVEDIRQVSSRDLARWLRQRVGAEPAVIATSPTLATPLIFHSGLQTTGTLYWENRDGLKTMAALFGARSADEAQQIIKQHGITYLVFVSWEDFFESYARLGRELPVGTRFPNDAFMLQFFRTKIAPSWLRPIPIQLPEDPMRARDTAFVFEVVSPQSLEESLTRTAAFYMDTEQPEVASGLVRALELRADFLPATITLARIQLRLQQREKFRETMRRVAADRAGFASLGLEDRVQLVTLLGVIGDTDGARRECRASWAQAETDQTALRKLPQKTVMNLLQQALLLEVKPPVDVHQFALKLLPPQWLDKIL